MEEDRGISFGDILGMLKKHIWWILAASAVAALTVGLLFGLYFNKGKVTYKMTFMMQYPNSESKTLPDGTPFHYQTVISSENIKAAKESDKQFSSVDISKMMSRNNIEIEELTVPAEGVEQGIRYTGVYQITVSGNYFEDAGQASSFLKAIVGATVDDVLSKVGTERYSANLSVFDSLVSYSEQIDCLVRQRDFLTGRYSALSPKYGDRMVNGKTLDNYSAEVNATLSDETVSRLRKDLSNNRYMLTETENDILVSIQTLKLEKEKNEASIASLEVELGKLYERYPGTGVTATFEAFHSRIAALIEKNAEIDIEVRTLYKSIGYEETEDGWTKKTDKVDGTAFEAEIKSLRDKLAAQTDICKTVIDTFYRSESRAVFGQDEANAETGGRNPILLAAVAFVGVFIVAAFIVCLVRYPKYVKARAALHADGEQTAAGKTQE